MSKYWVSFEYHLAEGNKKMKKRGRKNESS